LRAIEEGLAADGTFVALNNRLSQSVPHVHVHLVPRHRKNGLKGFFWPRQRYQDEAALRQVQDTLRAAIARLQPRFYLSLIAPVLEPASRCKEDGAGLRLSPRPMRRDRPSPWYNRMGDVCTFVSEPFETLAEKESNPSESELEE